LYYQLHAEVEDHLDRVRRTVTDGGSTEAVLVRTSDHGELLGAHGGLHQKWFNLYDEATRVPFLIARSTDRTSTDQTSEGRRAVDQPTSHVDLIPTLLGAAGIDQEATAEQLGQSFTEVHPLPGRNLMPLVDDQSEPDTDRAVYLLTRDNMPEGDSGASGMARRLGRAAKPPRPLRIQVPAHVAANHEGIVVRVTDAQADGGGGRLWKIVRSFDDPATWTEPGIRHMAATGPAGLTYRTEPLPDQWELYDLETDPIEADNRWRDPEAAPVFEHLCERLAAERERLVPD
ncbi:MAG: sulfatase-like hydrolase/transferase, partial [Actinomycetia bacterium]|nr:sulfatase-like hydrolase/transferase [Actinomycetes bacterium]